MRELWGRADSRPFWKIPTGLECCCGSKLPAEVADGLADAPPRPVEGAFVDESLRGTRSDRTTLERQILAYIAQRFPTTQAALDTAHK